MLRRMNSETLVSSLGHEEADLECEPFDDLVGGSKGPRLFSFLSDAAHCLHQAPDTSLRARSFK